MDAEIKAQIPGIDQVISEYASVSAILILSTLGIYGRCYTQYTNIWIDMNRGC